MHYSLSRTFIGTAIGLTFIVALGFGLRLINSDEPLWGDELVSLQVTTELGHDPQALTNYLTVVEQHPPLYYLGLHQWMLLTGEQNETLLRLPSLVVGLLIIVVGFFLTRELFASTRAGFVAAFLLAILPMQIEYSVEARPYIMYALVGLISAWLLWRACERKYWWYAAGVAVSALVGLYLHVSFLLLLVPLYCFWAVIAWHHYRNGHKDTFYQLLLSGVIVVLGYAPWFDAILTRLFLGEEQIADGPRTVSAFRSTTFFEGIIEQLIWTTKNDARSIIETISILLAKLGLVGSGIALFLHQRVVVTPSTRAGRLALFLVFATALPTLLFLLTPQSLPYTSIPARHLITVGCFLAVIIGGLLARVRWRMSLAVLAVLVASLIPSVALVVGDDAEWDLDHRYQEVARYIGEYYQPGDVVVSFFGFVRSAYAYYLDSSVPLYGYYPVSSFVEGTGGDGFQSRRTFGLIEAESVLRLHRPQPEAAEQKINLILDDSSPTRIWLVGFAPGDPALAVLKEKGWRRSFRSIWPLFPVDRFDSPSRHAHE